MLMLMNGRRIVAQLCLMMLKIQAAIDDALCNSARKQLGILESLLAEPSILLVDDGTMKNNTSSLENLQKKSRRKVERIFYFWI